MAIFALFVGLIFLYSLISARLKQTIVTGPILFALGFSALPFIERYARRVATLDASAPENN